VGIVVERVREDERLEVLGDVFYEVDPRMASVLVHKSIDGPLFASFYAYVGRRGLPENELPTDPGLQREQHGVSYGHHDGPTVGLHQGDVVGNLKGFVESLDNHRTLRATVIGELHGHADGTFQGEATGTFTGAAYIDGGELAHIEALAVGTSTNTNSAFVVRAPGKHIRLESDDDQQGTLELRDGELFFDVPLAAVSANIGTLRSLELVCTQLRALLGIRNSYAGIREAGVLTGVSDAEVERGLYFGQHRLAAVDGAFRIVREVNSEGEPELVVQTPVDGTWTTVRPVGALGATSVGAVTALAPRPGVERIAGKRPVLVVGEALGELVVPTEGNLVQVQVNGLVANTFPTAANLVPFPDATWDVGTVFVDVETRGAPNRCVWRGELQLRRGELMEYGSAPHGNLDVLATSSATAYPESSFELALPDAPRHFRHALRLVDSSQFAPADNFFNLVGDTYIARAGRGPISLTVKAIVEPAPAPAIVPSTRLVRPLAPMGVDVIDVLIGSRMRVYLDGVLLIERTLETTRSNHSLGSLFTSFRQNPRRVRVEVTHPAGIPGSLEFDVHAGLPAMALTNGAQTWTGLVPYSWSQLPNARDVVASFTEASAGNAHVLKVPLDVLSPGGTIEIDMQFRDGTFGVDTASYAFVEDGTYLVATYPNRRGAAQVRIRSLVVV